MRPQIVILTGPPGAGKSTINKILAKKFEKSAIISSDEIRDMIKNGRENPGSGKEWKKQINLSKKMTIHLIKNFYKSGFTILSDEIISNKKIFKEFYSSLKNFKPKFFLLLPSKEVVAKRDLERGENALKERTMYLYDKFLKISKKEKKFIVIDSSNQTPGETANKILEKLI